MKGSYYDKDFEKAALLVSNVIAIIIIAALVIYIVRA